MCKPCMHSGYATDSGNNIWAQGNICSTPEPPALGHCVTALAAALPLPEPLLSRRLPGPPPALGIEGTVSFHPPKPCAAVTSTGTLSSAHHTPHCSCKSLWWHWLCFKGLSPSSPELIFPNPFAKVCFAPTPSCFCRLELPCVHLLGQWSVPS